MSYQQPTQPTSAATKLDEESQALVTALTAAIVSSRQATLPAPNQLSDQAADEYAEIKGALRTHAEPFPTLTTSGTGGSSA